MRGMMQGIQAAEFELRVAYHMQQVAQHRQHGLILERQGANLAAVWAQVANPLPMSRVGPNIRAGNFHGQPTVGPSNLHPGNTFSYQVTQSANPIPAAPPAATAVPPWPSWIVTE